VGTLELKNTLAGEHYRVLRRRKQKCVALVKKKIQNKQAKEKQNETKTKTNIVIDAVLVLVYNLLPDILDKSGSSFPWNFNCGSNLHEASFATDFSVTIQLNVQLNHLQVWSWHQNHLIENEGKKAMVEWRSWEKRIRMYVEAMFCNNIDRFGIQSFRKTNTICHEWVARSFKESPSKVFIRSDF